MTNNINNHRPNGTYDYIYSFIINLYPVWVFIFLIVRQIYLINTKTQMYTIINKVSHC